MSPPVAAVLLGSLLAWFVLQVVQFVAHAAWLEWPLTGAKLVCLGTLAGYLWTRLTGIGRGVVALTIGLFVAALLMAELDVPGAAIVGYAGWVSFLIFVAFGVTTRSSFVQWHSVSSAFLRTHRRAEVLRLELGQQTIRTVPHDGDPDEWLLSDVEMLKLDERRRVLEITDRIGDTLLAEIHEADVPTTSRWLEERGGPRGRGAAR